MIITNNKVVSINYMLKDELGNVLQGNDGFTPEEYLHGADNILPGLERALEGLKQDQVIDVVIDPEEAYGPKEVSLIIEVSNDDLEDYTAINEGEYIQLFDGTEAIVVEKKEDHIIVDANHPLAGQTLYYTVKISGIRDATEEEIAELAVDPSETAKALAVNPADPALRATHALALLRAGRAQEAGGAFEDLTVFFGRLPPGLQSVVYRVLASGGQDDLAASALQKIDKQKLTPEEAALLQWEP